MRRHPTAASRFARGLERAPRHRRGALLALAVVAAIWPAMALAALWGTIGPPWRRAAPPEGVPPLPLLRTLVGHADEVTAIAVSPDGALFASASADGTVRLADAAGRRGTSTLRRDGFRAGGAAPRAVAVSRGGALVAIGDPEGAVDAWDAATGRPLPAPPQRGRPATALAFHPLAATLAVGYADGVVVLWDPRRGREVWASPPREATFLALAFSPDGRTLATGGWYDAPLTLRDAATGREQRTLAREGTVWAVRFSPDGRTVAATGQDEVTLWDAAAGALVRSVPADSTGAVGFAPDGAVVTVAGRDGVVRSWEVATGRLRREGRVGDPVGLTVITPRQLVITATAHDGRSGSDAAHGATVNVWDARPDRP